MRSEGAADAVRNRSDLALPDRALRRSILQSCTPVHSCRLSLAKPARLCDIAPYNVGWWCGAKAHAQHAGAYAVPKAEQMLLMGVVGKFLEILGVRSLFFFAGKVIYCLPDNLSVNIRYYP